MPSPGDRETAGPGTAGPEVVVACAADAAYAIPLAAMLHSALARLRPGSTMSVHVVDAGLGADDRAGLVALAEQHGATLRWHDPPAPSLASLPAWGRMTSATYHRLRLGELVPENATRAIWLDCDLLVTTDLVHLWETDLAGRHVLAARDVVVPLVSSRYGVRRWQELGLPRRAPYFNAGVMLVDLARWREDDIGGHAAHYLERTRDATLWDQEGLNVALVDRWGELDPRWNRPASADRRCRPSGTASAWIVHFSGALKPWLLPEPAAGPRALFYHHLDQTPWAGWRPRPTATAAALGWYESSRLRDVLYRAEPWVMLSARRGLASLTGARGSVRR